MHSVAAFALLLLTGVSSSSFAFAADAAADGAAGDRHPVQPSNDIIVTAGSRERSDLLSSVSALSGLKLQEDQRQSIGESIAKLPGVSTSSFGPTASRPILRGLAGDRVRVLTDGIGSFDASATSADHAVAVNPLTAERIEVIRGPAALLYGSSAIGGVVNVIDNRIPRTVPNEPVHLQLDGTYGTAAKERNAAGAVDLPIAGKWVAHLDGSYDRSNNLDTGGFILSQVLRDQAASSSDPAIRDLADLREKIPNTQAKSWDVAGGLAYIGSGGNIGISVARYNSLYGVPIRYGLDPAVEDESPRIDLHQTRFDLRAEIDANTSIVKAIRLRAGYADYHHDELEKDGSIGTSFFNKGMEGRVDFDQTKHGAWSGTTGAQVITRNFYVIGDEKFLPPTQTEQAGLFTLQTFDFGKLKLEAGGRIEREQATARADETVGNPTTKRSFTAYSGSIGASYALVEGIRVGLNLTHTERSPDAEELFSNGPHGGTQAFEVGDISLAKERSNGVEAVLHARGTDYSFDLSGYYNRFGNFIFQNPTGAIEDDLPVYAFFNGKAKQYGFEAEGQVTAARFGETELKLEGQADYVIVDVDNFGPAPLIPPFRMLGAAGAYSPHFDVRGEVERDFRHDHTAPNETETPGFTLVNASLAWRPQGQGSNISIRLQANNIFDVVARRSTSLLKDYAPLAGRDIRVGASFRI